MDVCNEENSASFHTVALDFPVITNPRAFRSECFSTQTLFSPKGPVGLLVFGWANCMWILSWCYFLGEKLGLHCPPRHLIQPAGSCGVSKRPADGSTAEFSRGLVQARHGGGSYHIACTNHHSPVAASLGRQRGLDQQEKTVAHPHGDRAVYKEPHPPMCRRFSYIDRLRVAL